MMRSVSVFSIVLFFCSIQLFANNEIIRISGLPANAPYYYEDKGGNPDGFVPNVAELIMNHAGLEYRMSGVSDKHMYYHNSVAMTDSILKTCDLYMLGTISMKKRTRFYYSIPYLTINFHIASKKGTTYSGPYDFRGKKLLVTENHSSHARMCIQSETLGDEVSYDTLLIAPTMNKSLRMIANGEADYLLLSEQCLITKKELIKKYGLEINYSNFDPLYVAIASKDKALIAKINNSIKELKEHGEFRRLFSKYVLPGYRTERETNLYRIVVLLLLIVVGLLLIIYVFRKILIMRKQLNDTLTESLKRAFEMAYIGTWEYNIDSKKFEVIYGNYTNEIQDAISIEDLIQIIHTDDREMFQRNFDQLISGEISKIELTIRMKNTKGEYDYERHILERVYRKQTKEYVVTGVYQVITHIVDMQKDIENERESFKFIADNAPMAILIKDPDTQEILYHNPATLRVLGIDDADTTSISSTIPYITPASYDMIVEKDNEVLMNGGSSSYNQMLELVDGTRKYFYVNKTIMKQKGKDLILVIRFDYGEQQRQETSRRLLDVSVPVFKAYTWSYDGRIDSIIYVSGYADRDSNIVIENTFEDRLKYIHPDDKNQYRNLIDEILEKGSGELHLKYRSKIEDQQNYEWWEVHAQVETIAENGEQYIMIYGITINVNEKTEQELLLKENQSRLLELNKQNELILSNNSSGIVYVDNDDILKWSNLSQLGFTSDSSEQNAILCLRSRGGNEICVQQDVHTAKIERRIVLTTFTFKEQEEAYEVLITPIFDAQGYEGVVIKIDDVWEREQMLFQLTDAKIKAERSDKIKSIFLANMSHEIRTPLNAIVGFSNLLAEVDDQEEKDEYVELIRTNNDILLHLINDILDLSKLDAGIEFNLESLDFAEYFNVITTSLRYKVSNPNVEFIVDNPYKSIMATMDKHRTGQIITNFTTNAIKHTQSGSIRVGYTYVDGILEIYVQDTGRGIPAEKQHLVFQRFQKLDKVTQGTGLGLSIVKALVERAHGECGFESEEGVGSRFYVRIKLPMSAIQDSLSNDQRGDNANAQIALPDNLRILIVEDIRSNYLLLEKILKNQQLTHVENGSEALQKVKEETFDFILMDLNLPKKSGIDTTIEIREFDTEIPIIAVSANSFMADQDGAMAAGCNDFVPKPVDKDELISKMLKYLK